MGIILAFLAVGGILTLIVIPTVVVLSEFLRKHIFKSLPLILVPVVAIIILQLIPFPRFPLGNSYLHGWDEPTAIGLGFPFSIAKVFLGDSNYVPVIYEFNRTNLRKDYGKSVHLGSTLWVGTIGILFGAIYWIPIFAVAYFISLNKLRAQKYTSTNSVRDFYIFAILLIVFFLLIFPIFGLFNSKNLKVCTNDEYIPISPIVDSPFKRIVTETNLLGDNNCIYKTVEYILRYNRTDYLTVEEINSPDLVRRNSYNSDLLTLNDNKKHKIITNYAGGLTLIGKIDSTYIIISNTSNQGYMQSPLNEQDLINIFNGLELKK